MSIRRHSRVALWMLLGLGAAASPVRAQDADSLYGRTIVGVLFEIEGRPAASLSPSLNALIAVKVGDPMRSEAIRETIVRLVNAGGLEDVQVLGTEKAAGVELLFKLKPQHPVDRLQFTGDLGLTESVLQRLVRDRFGGLPTRERAANVATAVSVILNDEGFPEATVTSRVEETHDPDRASLVLDVRAGRRALVSSTRVEGTSPLSEAVIIARTGTVPGQPFRRRAVDEALAAILDDLRRQGYYSATAFLRQTPDLSLPEGVPVVLRVEAGPRVTLRWEGPKPPGDSEDFVPMRRQRSADADLLEDADRALESYWRRQGYKNVHVTHTSERVGEALVITMRTDRGQRYRVDDFRISGNAHIPEATIREVLGMRPGDWFDETRVLAGMVQVRLVYLRQGFYKATVRELDPEDAPVAQAGVDVGQVVRVDITEGPQMHVGTVTLIGIDPRREFDVRERMRTRPGLPYSLEDQAQDRASIESFYRDRGFENQTDVFTSKPGSEDGTMDVVVTVTEGPQLVVGDIRVVGYQRVRPEIVFEAMTLRQGEPYGEAARLESQRRLYNLGLFRRVSIDQAPGLDDELAHLVVSVEELPPTSVSVGGGVEAQRRFRSYADGSTLDVIDVAPRGFFGIGRRNLGGKNRSIDYFMRGTLRRGQQEGDGYGFSEYRVAGTYFEPHAFHSDSNLTAGISSERAIRSTFDFVRQTINTDLLRRLTTGVTVSGRYSLQFTHLLDAQIPIDEQPIIDRFFPQVRLSILSSGVAWDRRNDPIDPVRGGLASVDGAVAARSLGSEVGFAKLLVQGSTFRSLSTTRRVVFAGRAELGVARGFEREVLSAGQTSVVADLPASERFFAGGSTTVRGFQLDRLGTPEVLDANGNSKGGNGVVVLNAELRTTVAKLSGRDLGVVGFTDAGNVFARASQIDFSRLRGTYGVGIRYNSVLGPIRLDFGIKARRQAINGHLEHGWEYHLNLGEAF